MSNILITGSNGFIGSNILKKTYSNNKIILILRKKNHKKKNYNKNIKKIYYSNYVQLDKKLKKIKAEIIIHCATHYIKEHKTQDISKFASSNILLGNIILDNLKNMKTKKFINFSTVWEDYNGIRDNNINLYSVYKKAYALLLNYYKKKFQKIFFYEIMLSETFGLNDKRQKLINVLRNNYKKNRITRINSSNLFINLLNVDDITEAIKLIIKKNIKPKKYVLKNKSTYKISNLISLFNKNNTKKIKVKWLSKRLIKERIFKYKTLNEWTPKQSKIDNIFKIIKG
ncbi:NAD-dependent epimerase/dehydratase family protein [Candidatus Pelagibacter sp.]|nr:NAD-dependent epimerase/dehydratase family protein [Candidatus Pelagibacter sp.]